MKNITSYLAMKTIYLLLFFSFSCFTFSQGWIPQPTCSDSPYLVFRNDSEKFGVIDTDSNIVIPAKYDAIYFKRSANDTCRVNDSIAVLVSENKGEVINLRSLEKIKPSGEIQFIGDYIFYKDSLAWGVYDLKFNHLVKVKDFSGDPLVMHNYFVEWSIIDFDSYDFFRNRFVTEKWEERVKVLEVHPVNLNAFKNIVSYRVLDESYARSQRAYSKYQKKIKRNPLKYRGNELNGLINLSNLKKIKAKYHRINPVLYNNEIYFWCFRFKELLKKDYHAIGKGDIRIYDINFKNVNKVSFDIYPTMFDHNFISEQILNPVSIGELFIIAKNGKYGAYNGYGTEVIPATNDSIEYLSNNLYKVTNKQRKTLYNSEGAQALEGGYTDF